VLVRECVLTSRDGTLETFEGEHIEVFSGLGAGGRAYIKFATERLRGGGGNEGG
jgi:hypothetical protein